MCGIAGIVSTRGVQGPDLMLMARALQHRGPDGYGYMLYSPREGMRCWLNQEIPDDASRDSMVGFAHLRLSIVDLTADSLQPMVAEAAGLSLIYNGEIYNYIELRAELEALGHSFTTSGDTEVLMKAYDQQCPAY